MSCLGSLLELSVTIQQPRAGRGENWTVRRWYIRGILLSSHTLWHTCMCMHVVPPPQIMPGQAGALLSHDIYGSMSGLYCETRHYCPRQTHSLLVSQPCSNVISLRKEPCTLVSALETQSGSGGRSACVLRRRLSGFPEYWMENVFGIRWPLVCPAG